MEVITIESEAFRQLIERLETIEKHITANTADEAELETMYLDALDVCSILHISPRTLQRLRSRRIISYSRISGKTYYTIAEIQRVLRQKLIRRSEECVKELITYYKTTYSKYGIG